MADGDPVVAAQLATLAEGMRHVQQSVSEIKGDMRQQSTEAAAGRARLYGRIEEIGRQNVKLDETITGVKEDIEALKKDVREDIDAVDKKVDGVKIVTDRWTRWQWMGAGMVVLIGVGMTIFGGLIAAYWKQLIARFWP